VDITERKRGELRMETLANYDTLTGCANRNLFADRLSQAIARCKRGSGRAALLYLDIDRFKGINDSLGHDAGDALLKEFAARLKVAVRESDTVGRLGGDEFAILLEEVKEEGAPERVAQKILEAMRAPVNAGGNPVSATTSIGIALFGADAGPEAVAKRADLALYEAKAAGRNAYRVAV
jgi:diguanylate cyclase (GGDEF)-like protein